VALIKCVFLQLVAEVSYWGVMRIWIFLINRQNFLSKIISGDETLCFQYDPGSKRQSLQWKQLTSPRPTKIRHVEITDEENARHFLRYEGYCSL